MLITTSWSVCSCPIQVVYDKGEVYSFSKHGRFCHEIKMNYSPYTNYFTRVFWNRSYHVYKVNSVISFQYWQQPPPPCWDLTEPVFCCSPPHIHRVTQSAALCFMQCVCVSVCVCSEKCQITVCSVILHAAVQMVKTAHLNQRGLSEHSVWNQQNWTLLQLKYAIYELLHCTVVL